MWHSLLRLICWSLICTLVIIVSIGCRKSLAVRQAQPSSNSDVPPVASKSAKAPEAQILVDEAMLKKPYAVIGGTVQNIGVDNLQDLRIEVELKPRAGGPSERREIEIVPKMLVPGEQGRYSLKVLSDDWSGSRIVRLRSGSRPDDLTFKTLPGAQRPPERMPDRVIHVIKEPRPKSKGAGEDFINTPDHPIPVP